MNHDMQIGWAVTDITPPLGTPLVGHPFKIMAAGVESKLTASALCLKDERTTAVVVSCDTALITNEQYAEIAALAAQQAEIDPANIIIAASHTHSGPSLTTILGVESTSDYFKLLRGKIADVVRQACANTRPARLDIAAGECPGYAFNRRYIMADDTIETHPLKGNPHIIRAEGPDSTAMHVLGIRDAKEKLCAAAVNFGCHATVMERTNRLISADYPGKLRKQLIAEMGEDSGALFLQGASGNICQVNPFDLKWREVGVAWTEKMGQALAQRAMELLKSATPAQGALRVLTETVNLPRRIFDADLVKWAEQHVERNGKIPELNDYGVEHYGTKANAKFSLADFMKTDYWADLYAREICDVVRRFANISHLSLTLKILAQDNWALAAIPAEVFAELAQDIRKRSPFGHTMVVTLANGWNGYIPTEQAFRRGGGYETRLFGASYLAPEAGAQMVDATVSLLKKAK
jgi:hypothetical protein